MLERLSEAEQVERYRRVKESLWNPPEAKAMVEVQALRQLVSKLRTENEDLVRINWDLRTRLSELERRLESTARDAEHARNKVRWLGPRILVEDCMRETAAHFRIKKRDLLSASRFKYAVLPRQVAMYLATQLVSDMGITDIGRRFSRDHATVMHGAKKIERLMAEDEKLKQDVETIRAKLTRHAGGTGA